MAGTRIKICGFTRPEEAARAAELGADFLGLNFVGGPRRITVDAAKSIIGDVRRDNMLPPRIVALCGFPSAEMPGCLPAGEITARLSVDFLQAYGRSQALLLNGDESAPYWLVWHVSTRNSIHDMSVQLHLEPTHAKAILLDTGLKGAMGGTGQSFHWEWIAEAREAGELAGLPPIILAGGLTPENVAEAIRIARPYAVDVSSGVETAGRPGVKDPIKMRDFIQAAKAAG